MERNSSPWPVALAVAGLLVVLLAGYGAAYWLRIPSMGLDPVFVRRADEIFRHEGDQGVGLARENLQFRTPFERYLFAPAKALHFAIDDARGVSSFTDRRFHAGRIGRP